MATESARAMASALPADPVRVGFASRDGQSRKIASRTADRLRADGLDAATLDLAQAPSVPEILGGTALVVVVAAVRHGRHLAPAERFLEAYKAQPGAPPLALASVNLTARKPEKRTVETNPYLKKLIARHGLRPVVAGVFAGALDYPRYGWLDRQMIRLIMWLTNGPADGTSSADFTQWADVDAFAGDIAAALRSTAA